MTSKPKPHHHKTVSVLPSPGCVLVQVVQHRCSLGTTTVLDYWIVLKLQGNTYNSVVHDTNTEQVVKVREPCFHMIPDIW